MRAFRRTKKGEDGCQAYWPTEIKSKYETVTSLGQGCFGTVSLAKSRSSSTNNKDDLVAIKVINCSKAKDHLYARREIDILREINHPNIVKLLDSWAKPKEGAEVKCAGVMVMSYARGETLSSLIRRGGAFSEKVGLVVMAQLADAVSYLHGRAVCHRDIKPANVVVSCPLTPEIWNGDHDMETIQALVSKYRVTLVDFGFARALSPEDLESKHSDESESLRTVTAGRNSVSHTAVKRMTALGTLLYGAPEIFDGAYENSTATFIGSEPFSCEFDPMQSCADVVANYSFLCDAFALGMTFKHMMTGVPPNVEGCKVRRLKAKSNSKLRKWMSGLVQGTDTVQRSFKTLDELPQAMQDMIWKTCEPEPSMRLSVRACRRSTLISSVLGEAAESADEIDFLSFAEKASSQKVLG